MSVNHNNMGREHISIGPTYMLFILFFFKLYTIIGQIYIVQYYYELWPSDKNERVLPESSLAQR